MSQDNDNWIERGRSRTGGWSKEQLALIGVSWPPEKGWKKRVARMDIPAETIERFIQLKDKHLD